MIQIVESVVGTLTNFINAYGAKVVVGVAVVVGLGIVLTVLRRVFLGRGSHRV
jgi:hypothetical protein